MPTIEPTWPYPRTTLRCTTDGNSAMPTIAPSHATQRRWRLPLWPSPHGQSRPPRHRRSLGSQDAGAPVRDTRNSRRPRRVRVVRGGLAPHSVLDVPVSGLPPALDGLRIGHLSDFHLGAPLSRGTRASERAATWVAERRPDLVCVTGDLVSHPRGEPRLRALLALLDYPLVVLGNHDVAVTRDPFSRAAELRDLERARLLCDEAAILTLGGEQSLSRASPRKRTESAVPGRMSSSRPGLLFESFSATFRASPAAYPMLRST